MKRMLAVSMVVLALSLVSGCYEEEGTFQQRMEYQSVVENTMTNIIAIASNKEYTTAEKTALISEELKQFSETTGEGEDVAMTATEIASLIGMFAGGGGVTGIAWLVAHFWRRKKAAE